MIKISPSILAADFARLADEVLGVSTADYLHFDVMDGLFVPNISIGLPVLKSVRKITDMILDVHLMIQSPARYVKDFVESGADIVVFHVEAETPDNIFTAIDTARRLGKKIGLSVKPATAAKALLPYIDMLDIVLVMTVEPGFGGQEFISDMLPKISEIRSVIENRNLNCELEVDGGINAETAKLCVNAGADVLVAGSYIFGVTDRAKMIETLRAV